MASVAWHLHAQVGASGEARLFEGSGGYAAGEQRRDFVYVGRRREREPLVLRAAAASRASSTSAPARARPSTRSRTRSSRGTARARSATSRFRPSSKSRYQSFTEADISALRAAGYARRFATCAPESRPTWTRSAGRRDARPTRCWSSGRRGWATWSWRKRCTGCCESVAGRRDPRASRRPGRCRCSRACPRWRAASSSLSATASSRSAGARSSACALRRERYARAIVLPRSAKAALVPWFAKIPRRTGLSRRVALRAAERRRRLEPRLDQTVKRFVALGLPRGEAPPESCRATLRPRLSHRSAQPRAPAARARPGRGRRGSSR